MDDAAYYYEQGNQCRRKNDWQGALQNYAQALELNPDSPAREAREMLMEIIQFYDKERYNV